MTSLSKIAYPRLLILVCACSLLSLGSVCVQGPVNSQTGPVTNVVQETPDQTFVNEPVVNTESVIPEVNQPVVSEGNATLFFSTDQLGQIDSQLEFSAQIPSDWEVEYIEEIGSINFYDPKASGDSNLEKSQIFVRYFEASQFLTLQTVTIHSRTESNINGRPAVTYEIEKKSGVGNFPYQPEWRNERHVVTDIRSTDESPTVFYVFAQRPGLDTEITQSFLNSVSFEEQQAIYFPVENFTQQATKKVFGTYITPATSPIQPERFSGYHTGVDVEVTQAQLDQDVPVFAIADGEVSLKQMAQGYGGVLALEFEIDKQTYNAIYGHVRLSSIKVEVGDQVSAGEQLGFLGTGFSTETDGERKHLHFGLVPGTSATLLGYVSAESQLSSWVDPLDFFLKHVTLEP